MTSFRLPRAVFTLLLAAAAAACSSSSGSNGDGPGGAGSPGGADGGGDPDHPGGGPGGADAAPPRKVCTGFGAHAADWKVPDDTYSAVNALYGQWITMDLDGDKKPDLVRANDPANDGHAFASGGPHWQFYKGGDAGFAKTPSSWAVPDDSYSAVNALYGQWLTMDLDGDGKLDLVRANDPANDGHAFTSGGPHWQFYKGGDGGFSKSPSSWTVPDDSYSAVRALYGQWVTMDLDGDGKLDLVRANDPANDGHAFTSGGPHWQFYAGGASGFAKTPSSWAVPDDTYSAVNALYGQWLTMDLDGDGKVDLVRANDPANDGHAFTSGGAHWNFYKGGAAGFAKSPSAWAVPDDSYSAVRALYGQWVTMDLDDDGKVDLVRANDPKNDGHAFTSGGAHWEMYKGGGAGFASTPSKWAVPDDSYSAVNALYGQWLTMDLDGDGCIDLVRANDPANDGHPFAGPAWRFYAAQ